MEKSITRRKFKGSDAYLVNQCSFVHDLVAQDLGKFTDLDKSIDAAYLNDFAVFIQQAFQVVSDEVAIIPQKNATLEMKDLVKKGKKQYETLMYFVTKRAFPNNSVIAKEFGVGKMRHMSSAQARFTLFMETLFQKATHYKTELVAAGCQPTLIDQLELTAKALLQINVKKETLKRSRPVLTGDRIMVLNNCYAVVNVLNAAARIVYSDDAAKKKAFVYKPATKKGQQSTQLEGSIEPACMETMFDLPYKPERTIGLRAIGTDLQFGFSNDGNNIIGKTIMLKADDFLLIKCKQIAPEGNQFICMNQSQITGTYVVEWDG